MTGRNEKQDKLGLEGALVIAGKIRNWDTVSKWDSETIPDGSYYGHRLDAGFLLGREREKPVTGKQVIGLINQYIQGFYKTMIQWT